MGDSVVPAGRNRRLSLWVKSLVVLLVVFIGIPSGVFVYRKWVDWRVNVEVEKTIESDEVHDLVHDYLKKLDPNAFTERGAIRGFAVKKESGRVVPMGGVDFDLAVSGDGWQEILGIDLVKGPGEKIVMVGYSSSEQSRLYSHLKKRYGEKYVKAVSTGNWVTVKSISRGKTDKDE